jgi:N-acetylglucosaminyl-diphospho-decaprenol L-rhamnosyltransferase
MMDVAKIRTPRDLLSEVKDDYNHVMVAIVSYKNPDDVCTCLSALSRAKAKNFVISVCENGGLTSFRSLIKALDDIVEFDSSQPGIVDFRVAEARAGRLRAGGQPVRICRADHNLGYAGGVNVSLRQLLATDGGQAVWILNPDTEPDPNALTALIARAREGSFGIVGCRLLSKSTHRVLVYGGRWRPWIACGFHMGVNAPQDAVPNIEEVESAMSYVSGASLFATRNYVENIGLMDERYFLYCEEVDWCLRRRSQRLGYAHDSIVYHAEGTTIGSHGNRKKKSSLSVYLEERSRLLLTRRFYPARYPLVIVTTFMLTLRFLAAGAAKNFFVALCGWWAGLRGEEGLPQRFVGQLETSQTQ